MLWNLQTIPKHNTECGLECNLTWMCTRSWRKSIQIISCFSLEQINEQTGNVFLFCWMRHFLWLKQTWWHPLTHKLRPEKKSGSNSDGCFSTKLILNRWKRFLPPLNAGLLIGKVTHPARHISCRWDRWRSRLGRSRWWKNPVSKGFVFLKVRDLLEDDLSPHLILD